MNQNEKYIKNEVSEYIFPCLANIVMEYSTDHRRYNIGIVVKYLFRGGRTWLQSETDVAIVQGQSHIIHKFENKVVEPFILTYQKQPNNGRDRKARYTCILSGLTHMEMEELIGRQREIHLSNCSMWFRLTVTKKTLKDKTL
jgi:hypothetical protein